MCYICCAHCCLCDIWEQMWLVMGATYYVPQWNKLSFLSHFIWRNRTRSSKSYLVLMENQKSVQLALSGSCENKNSVTRVWLQWFTLPEVVLVLISGSWNLWTETAYHHFGFEMCLLSPTQCHYVCNTKDTLVMAGSQLTAACDGLFSSPSCQWDGKELRTEWAQEWFREKVS